MKKLKLSYYALLLTLITITFGCEKDVPLENLEYKSNSITSEKVDLNQVLSQIQNPDLKNYLKNQNQLNDNSKYNTTLFDKIIKGNMYTTYSLQLNNFSESQPYFYYFIIKKEGANEFAGFIKYIPTLKLPILDVKKFTGVIEVYSIDEKLDAITTFSKGIPESSLKVTNKGCTNNISVITHVCTHGGGHTPGQSCGNGLTNDSYYEIVINRVCTTDYQTLTPPDSAIGNNNSGGGGGGMAYQSFFDALGLNDIQKDWLDNNEWFKYKLYELFPNVSNVSDVLAIKNEFITNLNFLMNNTSVIEDINNYLIQNQYSEISQDYASIVLK